MTVHSYFGKVEMNWDGFSSEYKIKIPYFDKEVDVFLGEEFDEDGEEVSLVPTEQQLDEFEQTLKAFLSSIDSVIIGIQQSAFDYYQRIYAKYYEKPFEVLFENSKVQKKQNGELHESLNINTKEKHFEYMRDILHFRIIEKETIKISIGYDLDAEHGLEVKLEKNKVAAVSGIADT